MPVFCFQNAKNNIIINGCFWIRKPSVGVNRVKLLDTCGLSTPRADKIWTKTPAHCSPHLQSINNLNNNVSLKRPSTGENLVCMSFLSRVHSKRKQQTNTFLFCDLKILKFWSILGQSNYKIGNLKEPHWYLSLSWLKRCVVLDANCKWLAYTAS